MVSDRANTAEQVWRGPARSFENDEVTFIVALYPNSHEWHDETSSGERAERLGKGAYFFNGMQYEADDPQAP